MSVALAALLASLEGSAVIGPALPAGAEVYKRLVLMER
jgi:hypothetical protein